MPEPIASTVLARYYAAILIKGTALVNTLLNEARKTFHTVRLRAGSPSAARLYERLGFVSIPNAGATHLLHFDGHR